MDLQSSAPPACGNCRETMHALQLAGHYGRTVEIDLCGGCHLVWFDRIESARLAGPGMLALIGHMAAAQTLPHRPLDTARSGCARCGGGLKTVHNRTRWGRSLQLECLAAGHGAYQSFADFLGEKGLLRPMSTVDREALRRRGAALDCLNCGARLDDGETQCRWCRSMACLLDVARLARALDPEGATESHAVHATAARAATLQCLACGQALPGEPALQCPQCSATLAVARLADAHAQVAEIGPELQAHAAERPAPHVVKRRLAAQAGSLAREREFVAQLRAENDAQLSQREPEEFAWPDLGGAKWHVVVIAIALFVYLTLKLGG